GRGEPRSGLELWLVGPQALEAPRPPEQGRRGSRYRHEGDRLHPRAGGEGLAPVAGVVPPPRVAVLRARVPRGDEPALPELEGAVAGRAQRAPAARGGPARTARGRARRDRVLGALTGARGRLPRCATRGVRLLHGLLVRPEPQGHADRAEGSLDRLLPPPSAHEPQHPRRLVHRLPVRRAQLPDRTPPVPRDAARFAAQGRPDDPRILRGQEGGLHRGEHPGVLRDARRLPQPGWTRRARSLRLPARRPVAHGAIAPRASCRERGLSLGPVTGAEPPAENGAKLFETRFC